MTYWQERAAAERRLSAELDARKRLLSNAAAYLEQIRMHVPQRLEELSFEERRQLVLALCERIRVDGDGKLSVDGILGGQAVLIANQPSLHPAGSRPGGRARRTARSPAWRRRGRAGNILPNRQPPHRSRSAQWRARWPG
ncbi:MAG TPA: hypothetical protein VGW38_04120 [Chloroflexota bacterium]|nr:hypothetical protein [Chloroflexota bacterium]